MPILTRTDIGRVDVLVLALRATQLADDPGLLDDLARPHVPDAPGPLVVPTMHLAGVERLLTDRVPQDRLVRAFPGLGGHLLRTDDGLEEVLWSDLGSAQPTTIDGRAPAAATAGDLFSSTGLPLATTPDMNAWMNAHAVFVGALGAGIVLAGGEARGLAHDRALLRFTCDAIRDGFQALRDAGAPVLPASVDLLHRRMPAWFAPLYWRRALAGPTGEVTIAPHVRASRADELPTIWREALRVTDGGRTGAFADLISRALDTPSS